MPPPHAFLPSSCCFAVTTHFFVSAIVILPQASQSEIAAGREELFPPANEAAVAAAGFDLSHAFTALSNLLYIREEVCKTLPLPRPHSLGV